MKITEVEKAIFPFWDRPSFLIAKCAERNQRAHNTRKYKRAAGFIALLCAVTIALGGCYKSYGAYYASDFDSDFDADFSVEPGIEPDETTATPIRKGTLELFLEKVALAGHLDEYEKEVILSFQPIFADYNDCIDYHYIIDTLDDLKICYRNEAINAGWLSTDDVESLGMYINESHCVVMCYWNNVEEYKASESTVLNHELLHYFSGKNGGIIHEMNEAITVLLTEEYFNEPPYLYTERVVFIKALCRLMGPETVLKAYFNGDAGFITMQLAKYISREEADNMMYTVGETFYDTNSLDFYDQLDDPYAHNLIYTSSILEECFAAEGLDYEPFKAGMLRRTPEGNIYATDGYIAEPCFRTD